MNAPAYPVLHTIVGNGHRAARYARMNAPGGDKYTTIHAKLTDDQIHAHLLGDATYAAIIIGADGLVSAACIELDADAIEGARRTLEAAAHFAVTAFSIAVKGAGNHDGSHTWMLFAERVAPDAAAYLAQQIATAAGYGDAEIWPKGNAIRLPFGVHTHTQRRGRLLLQTGETFDLDAGDLDAAGVAVAALPLNSTPPAPPKVEPTFVKELTKVAVRPTAGRASLDDVKAAFNAANPLPQLLAGYGAVQTSGKDYTCPFRTHAHENTLFIYKDRVFSRSPNCKIPMKRGLDSFGVYVLIEHNDSAVDAAKKLNPIEPRQRRQQAPTPPEPPRRTEAQAAYNARRLEQRRADNRAVLSSLYDLVNTLDIPDRAALLFSYLHQIADEAGLLQVRPTNAQIAEAIPDLGCERRVQRAFRDLEALDIGKRTGGKGGRPDMPNEPAAWSFNRCAVLRVTAETAPIEPTVTLGILESNTVPTLELTSTAQPAAPEAWELWNGGDAECSPYDLELEANTDPYQYFEPEELPELPPAPQAEPKPEPPIVEVPHARSLIATLFSRLGRHEDAAQQLAMVPQAQGVAEIATPTPPAEPIMCQEHNSPAPAPYWRVECYSGVWTVRGKNGELQTFGQDEAAARAALADALAEWAGVVNLTTPNPAEQANPLLDRGCEAQPEPDAPGASYEPAADFTNTPRRRHAANPKERAARAKAQRQAKLREMDAPKLRREIAILSRKADMTTTNPAQRNALKDLVAEMKHYLAIKDARAPQVAEAPPDVPRPHKLAAAGRPAAQQAVLL